MNVFTPEGSLSQAQSGTSCDPQAILEESFKTSSVLEGQALLCDKNHDLYVDYHGVRGVIPRSEGAIGIEDGTTKDIAMIARVGKSVSFIVSDPTTDNSYKCPIFSRRSAQLRCWNEYLDTLHPGDIIKGRITHMEHFGAFLDIGCGIPSLLPIDKISVSRISHPKDRLHSGQVIPVVVCDLSEGRVHLSHKELLGTWCENAALFSVGETVQGLIRSVEEYGVFIELTPNLAGLAEPFPGAKKGLAASVYIKSILPEKMKLKLTIVDCFSASYVPPMNYFIKEGHIDQWNYSPPGCPKIIRSDFADTSLSSGKPNF